MHPEIIKQTCRRRRIVVIGAMARAVDDFVAGIQQRCRAALPLLRPGLIVMNPMEYQAGKMGLPDLLRGVVHIGQLVDGADELIVAGAFGTGAEEPFIGVKILIGGGPCDQTTADYVGADAYCKTAQDSVEYSKKLLGIS